MILEEVIRNLLCPPIYLTDFPITSIIDCFGKWDFWNKWNFDLGQTSVGESNFDPTGTLTT